MNAITCVSIVFDVRCMLTCVINLHVSVLCSMHAYMCDKPSIRIVGAKKFTEIKNRIVHQIGNKNITDNSSTSILMNSTSVNSLAIA